MDQLPTNRRACDRCHTQKLSCKRREGSDSCLRCAKANLPCLLSPAKKRTHPPFSADRTKSAPSAKKRSKASSATVPISAQLEVESALTDESLSATEKQKSPPSPVRCDGQGLDPVANGTPGRCGTRCPEEPPDLDFSLMLENTGNQSCQSVLDFSQFIGDQTSDATPLLSPKFSVDASSIIFSAESPSSSSFATSVGSIPDPHRVPKKSNSGIQHMIDEGEPRPTSHFDSHSPSSSSRPTQWTEEQLWARDLGSLHQATTQSSGINMSAWVAMVAEVNTGLYQHAEQIPRVEILGQTSHQEKVFAVDQVFLLSQRLIDLLNQIYPRFRNGQLPPCVSSATSPCSLSGTDGSPTMRPPSCAPITSLDPGSILLVLSCHLRLLEIYEKIFFHIECWIRDRNSPTPPADIHFPGLNIGAFSLSSSSGLQVTLVIQLVEQLLGRLRDITLLMDTAAVAMGTQAERGRDALTNPFTSLNEVGDVALQAVKSRESDTMKNISRVKRLLQKSGIM